MSRVILASTSRYRRRLLAEAGIAVDAIAPDFDERSLDAHFDEWGVDQYVVAVATGKAHSVLDRVTAGTMVIAADQVAVLDGQLLTKPESSTRAVDQLMAMSGRTHDLVNGVVVAQAGGNLLSAVDRHVVTMRAFDAAEAIAYVDEFQPLDCVGSYRLEDDADLIESVQGSGDDGVIGLPIAVVRSLMALLG